MDTAEQAVSTLLAPPRPTTDVRGEDPAGIERLPGFTRTAFARDGDRLKVSWVGAAPPAQVAAYYMEQLGAAGYQTRVLAANAQAETLEFESPQRKLTLAVRGDGRGGSELDWEVR